jgi:uncharacterized protein (DUF362 family)
MTRVSITKVRGDVPAAFSLAMERAGCDTIIKQGDRVLIKPNWNACAIEGSTSLGMVLAACHWAKARGAGEIIVGEGPVPVGREATEAYFETMGASDAVAGVGARFFNFDYEHHEIFRDLEFLPSEIGVAKLALECDVLINIPLLKVHSCCLTTLCVKNLKGCLRPQDKMAFHRIGLLPAVVALNRLVKSQINVIDAINAMAGDHNRGDLIPLGLLIAGNDRVATDAVASAQIGLATGKVPLLKMAADAGLGEYRVEKIDIVGEPLSPRRFELPQDRMKSRFPEMGVEEDGACSACMAALNNGLYDVGDKRAFTRIALGAKAKPSDDALVLGNCLKAYFPTHAHVAGCPPDGGAIARMLKGKARRADGAAS